MERRPVVGVMGSGTRPWRERAGPLGALLARMGVHLLTGGGGGVMAAVSEAFVAVRPRAGLVLGVLPCVEGDPRCAPPPGYPNPWVEVALATHLPHSGERGTEMTSRNHVNVLSSDVLVALPGGAGTASETRLAVRYGRPVVAWLERPEELPGRAPEVVVAASLAEVEVFLRGSIPNPGQAPASKPPGR